MTESRSEQEEVPVVGWFDLGTRRNITVVACA